MPDAHRTAPLDTIERPAVALAPPARRLDAAAQPPAWSRDRSVVQVMPSPAVPRPEPPSTSEWPAGFRSISRTKITAPLLREETLTRGRLIDWLRRHLRQRLTLVIAEAGYGKTTLLADYGRRSNVPVLWLKLDHTDADWISLTNYLIAAYREQDPAFGQATLDLLDQLATADQSRDRIIDALLADITRFDHPAVLILDDYHLVDHSADAREIVARLLREAPSSLSVLIASRRRPDLELARPMAQGQVAELTTDDLRFSRAETDTLFTETYQQPLEPDVLDQLEQRTEGWAASLQLFRSSIRGRSALEVRAFTRAMSGTQGPIYDFLAQEVLRELTPNLRRFLVGSAILRRIVPSLVAAIFADDPEPPTTQTARSWIEAADDLGLIGRRGESGRGYRFHPLLREFLLRQLSDDVGADVIRQRHLRVATAAEADDWLTACYHYLEAGDPTQAVRVMSDSLLVAIGTGAWGVAADLLDRFPSEPDAPAVQVIFALREIEEGAVGGAVSRLERLELSTVQPQMRSLIRHVLLRASFIAGDLATAEDVVEDILLDDASVPLVRRLAGAFSALYLRPITNLEAMARTLERLGADCEREGFTYFAAVSYHNALEAFRAAALPEDGYRCGIRAIECFSQARRDSRASASTHAVMAICAAEMGRWALAGEHGDVARALDPDPDGDARSEVAYLQAALGWSPMDPVPTRRPLTSAVPPPGASSATSAMARASIALIVGDTDVAEATLDSMPATGAQMVFVPEVQLDYLRASVLLRRGLNEAAAALINPALRRAKEVGATSVALRLQLIGAVATGDGLSFQQALDVAAQRSKLTLLDTADTIVAGLDLGGRIPDVVLNSAHERPGRWRLAARGRIVAKPNPSSLLAAQLLESIGAVEDVPLLRAFERTSGAIGRGIKLAQRLAERASPTLEIFDLGETRLVIGNRILLAADMRRKCSSLIMYLASRPRQSATREQVLDDLWPALAPAAASNSLNQTMYFLRRSLDPWYEDGVSVDYVRHEEELVSLPAELVKLASVEFQTAARSLLRQPDRSLDAMLPALAKYSGRFAPDFEYEEWSIDWRAFLHGTYLDLLVAAERQLVQLGDLAGAASLARTALQVDPRNPDLHEALVWTLATAGSRPAASEAYSHYAALFRDEYGAEPPTLDEISTNPFLATRPAHPIRN
ncbi:MAG TPA: BTAD domain-containing putative transcriptional regulator [Candidatus Sulfotelmatobacter sp.]|nr:BTAD domain-containing putative transcriptional regulator [Candidatus Sulfotelmatobacter sp.]